MKDSRDEKLVEIKNQAENVLVVFGMGHHHVSKEDMRRAIEKLSHGIIEICNILLKEKDR